MGSKHSKNKMKQFNNVYDTLPVSDNTNDTELRRNHQDNSAKCQCISDADVIDAFTRHIEYLIYKAKEQHRLVMYPRFYTAGIRPKRIEKWLKKHGYKFKSSVKRDGYTYFQIFLA